MACTPQDLVTAASKFQGIPTGMQTNIATAVACQLAGIPADPQALVEASKCIECGKTEPILMAIAAVCNLSSGGATFTITAPSDPDAFAFWEAWTVQCFNNGGCTVHSASWTPGGVISLPLACATLCGTTQASADSVNTLVTSLKSAGLWTLLDVIYPMVGGNAGACSLNLKDPTKFAITWHGGVTLSAVGVTGDGSTGYGDTGYNPAVSGVNYTLNSAAMGFYRATAVSSAAFAGAINILGAGTTLQYSLVTGWSGEVNNQSGFGVAADLPSTGNYSISRTAANLTTIRIPSGSNATDANVPTAITPLSLWILAVNFESVPITFSADTLAFGWFGSGFSGAQITTLNGIINTFVAAK